MKKKNIIIFISFSLIALITLFILITGRSRVDVYLKDYEISSDGKIMTLKIGVTNSSGYVRKMKRTSGSTNYYYTFYSTFGINSRIGAKDTFIIDIDENVHEIYFFTGDGGYKLVLQKDINDNWIKPSNCNYEFKEYLTLQDKNIFTICIDEVNLKEKDEKITLKDYLTNNNDIQEFINKLELYTTLNDGGTKIYKNNDITLIKCNTLDGNKDIYIGSNSLDTTEAFQKGACGKNFINDKKFERVYKLNKIEIVKEVEFEDKNVNLYELELSDELGNVTKIPVVYGLSLGLIVDENKFAHTLKEEYLYLLEEGKYYKFTFNNLYGELIKEDIKEIFEKCRITKIEIVK